MMSTGRSNPRADDADLKARSAKRPEFNQLEIFLVVAEVRSFSAAARRLGRTQPAISRAIGRIEDICGADLFQRRTGAPLVLTPIGEAILPTARLLLHTVDDILVTVARTAQSRQGNLKLGFYPGLASGPLCGAIADFTAASPEVRLSLFEDMPGGLHRRLTERAIDLMVVALMPNLISPEFAQETLWEERLFVALPEAHPFAAQLSLPWRDIASLNLIMRASTREFTGYRALLRQVGNQAFECEQHEVSRGALLDMVAMGLGATITFESAVSAREGIVFLPVDDEQSSAAIQAIWPADDGNPLRHRLLAHIRAHARPGPERPISQ